MEKRPRKGKLLWIFLYVLSTVSLSWAQQPPSPVISLREAVELALRNNRSILLAQASSGRAAAEHNQARALFRPQVMLGSGLAYTRGFPLSIEGSAPSIFEVGSSQALFDRSLRYLERQAGSMSEAAESSVEDVRDQVVLETVVVYLDLDRSRQSIEHLRSQLQSLEVAAQLMDERVEAGLEMPLEATRARLGVARARSEMAAMEAQASLLEYRLRDLVGLPATAGIRTQAAEIPLLPPDATMEGWVRRAQANSPAVQSAEDEVEARDFQVRSETASRWPRVNLVGRYGLFSKMNNYDEYFQRFERNNATLGVSIMVPLYERERYAARLSAAQAELAAAQLRLEQVKAELERQVRMLWPAAEAQAPQREVARLELELARRSVEALLAQYEEGRVSRLQVEQARQEENRAWVNLLQADYESERARLELLRLAGEIRAALR